MDKGNLNALNTGARGADLGSGLCDREETKRREGSERERERHKKRKSQSTTIKRYASHSPLPMASTFSSENDKEAEEVVVAAAASADDTNAATAATAAGAGATTTTTAATTRTTTTTTVVSSRNKPQPPPLPLDWTRVKRKRSSLLQEEEEEDCNCDDPLFCSNGRRHRRPRAPLSLATVVTAAPTPQLSSSLVIYRGTAIICLQETNPDWFQGYFIPQVANDKDIVNNNRYNNDSITDNTHSSSVLASHTTTATTTSSSSSSANYWGLLGQQQEIDECLQCADGGYRELKLTIYPYNNKKIVISNVEWTGGDMMRLLQPEGRVRLEPQQLWTEQQAVPFCKRYFGGLLRRLQEEEDNEAEDNHQDAASSQEEKDRVLQLIPDVAIIVGAMELHLPKPG